MTKNEREVQKLIRAAWERCWGQAAPKVRKPRMSKVEKYNQKMKAVRAVMTEDEFENVKA